MAGFFEQRHVDECGGVAHGAGVPIPVPGAPEVAALFDDAHVVDARFFEPSAGDEPRETAADEDELDVVGERFSGRNRHVRVVEVVGEFANRFDVLLVAVGPKPLLSFRVVLCPNRVEIHRVSHHCRVLLTDSHIGRSSGDTNCYVPRGA